MLLIIGGNVYKKVYNGTVMNNLMNKMLAVEELSNKKTQNAKDGPAKNRILSCSKSPHPQRILVLQ